MITRYHKLALTAGFALAMAFTFGCSSAVESPPLPPPNDNSDASDVGGSDQSGSSPSGGSSGSNQSGSSSSGNGSSSNSSVTVNSSSSAQSKCGGVSYNPATQFCIDDKKYDKCNGSEYNPATQVCSGGDAVYTPNCEADLSTFCPGTNWSQVKWNTSPENNNSIVQGCYWVESWSDASNGNRGFANVTNFLINGVSYSKNSNKDDWNANKKDGGIYIYLPSTTPQSYATGYIYTGSKPPLCAVGYKLSCSIPTQWGANSPITPTLTCNYDSPSNEIWSSGAPNWDNPAAGDYNNISVSATCGTSGTLTANCGNLSVLTCQISSKLEEVCLNVNSSNWKTAINWNGPTSDHPSSGCYYAKSVSRIDPGGFGTENYMINGWEFSTSIQYPDVTVVDKLDDGYYVYLPGTVWNISAGWSSSKPACAL